MDKKPLRLWTCFWGEKHLDLFEKALVRSLSWPLNKGAIAHAKWDIWTKEEDFKIVEEVAGSIVSEIELHAIDPYLKDLESNYLNDKGVMINQMFVKSMRRCLDSGAQMLLVPPDTIFGGDSIANILQAGEQKGTVVFVPHIRVVPEILSALDGETKSISNARLCSKALKYAHVSFIEAEDKRARINSFIGGIFWKKRPNGVISINHKLPTPYLINFIERDYEFFSRKPAANEWPPVFGEIDHLWPQFCVHSFERARTLGSSDDAFICEVTEAEANVPALMNYDAEDPDRFWRNAMHNQINRQFLFTLRGEE